MSGENTNKVLAQVRNELLRLARFEDSLGAAEAESVPYWAPCPATVQGHRRAAVALRAHADAVGAWIAEVGTRIEWDSPTWGGGVTYAANGSWVADRHDETDTAQL